MYQYQENQRMTKTFFVSVGTIAALAVLGLFAMSALADSNTAVDFEDPPYTLGTINGQDGWTSLGAAGSGCAVYDHAVSSSFGVPDFGLQSLRISNAVTSGCFGDMTFSKSLTDEAGETDAQASAFSGGTRQNHFEAEFSIRPMQLSEQPGLFLSVSPDRGDGARMSYLGFEDTPGGVDVIFYDVQGTDNPANFVPTTVATGLSRATTHAAKFVIDFVDGPSNDVVDIYIDGVLVHTGTTWENYFRYDPESNPSLVDESRTVDSLLFRTGGPAAPDTLGMGYLIDNLTMSSSPSTPPPAPVTVTIAKYVDGVHADAGNATSLSFPMDVSWDAENIGAGAGSFALSTVGFNNPNPYEATTVSMTSGADYALAENLTEANVGASCSEGKPFALAGYTTGETEVAAVGETPTLTSPSLTDITDDVFIIVWNEKCETTLTLEKVVINLDGGVELDTAWTLSASGPTPITGVESDASITSATVTPGTYDLSEAGPGGYDASAWSCVGGTQTDDDTVDIAEGDEVVCTITNDDIPPLPIPPPPADACATPLVAPAGYTLLTGTNASDTVFLAPFTMFVGLNGNDIVNASDGNYIVCTGNGNDTIEIGNGDFTISAGNGNNNVTTGNGDGVVITVQANDTITTGDGVQTITAGSGNNTIVTGDGDKTVTTGNAIDEITTGDGNDVINAGGGINTVKSGAGNDTVTTGSSIDNIDGEDDFDTCNAGGGLNTVVNCEA